MLAAVLGATALVLAGGAPVVTAASGDPAVVTGGAAGPRPVHAGTLRTVASLALPAGRWWVTAKGVLESANPVGSDHRGVTCRLVLGTHDDAIGAAPSATGQDGSRVPFLLTTAHALATAGKAKLRCVGEGGTGTVNVKDIRITATRAGRLTVGEEGGSSVTSGSGTPRIITRQSNVRHDVPGVGSHVAISELSLPAGRWWIVAKAVLAAPSSWLYECRLAAGGDIDDKQVGVSATGYGGDAMPVAMQVVHTFGSGGTATVSCKGPFAFTATWVALAAIRVGTLTNRPLDGGSDATGGSGSPRVVSGWSDGPRTIARSASYQTVRSLSLPAGRWNVIGTLWVDDPLEPEVPVRRVWCRLAFGSDADASRLRQTKNVTNNAPMMLNVVHASSSPTPVRLRCRRAGNAGTVVARFIKITAIRAATLSRRAI